MPNFGGCFAAIVSSIALAATAAGAGHASDSSGSLFTFKDAQGQTQSARVISKYYPQRIVRPFATVDRRLDPKLLHAATLAEERAHAHSRERCWHYVKEALLASGAINSYPKTAYARQAGDELVRDYGFKRLSIRDPYAAPRGSVLVYADGGAAGHVEIRTESGFVSDYFSKTACRYRLIAVYGKFSS
jgi:hypothetical protein